MTLSRKRYGATLHNQYYARPEVALSNSVVRPSVLVSVPLISSKILTVERPGQRHLNKRTLRSHRTAVKAAAYGVDHRDRSFVVRRRFLRNTEAEAHCWQIRQRESGQKPLPVSATRR